MTEASAPVAATASLTVSKTGRPRVGWRVPPLPGVTPPTTRVPYARACSEWKVPFLPVKPWTMTLVAPSTKTAGSAAKARAAPARAGEAAAARAAGPKPGEVAVADARGPNAPAREMDTIELRGSGERGG